MRIAVILGTRPEIIKLSPVIRALNHACIDHYVVHTGQHYDYRMDGIFFEELDLERPAFNLAVGSGPQGKQTGRIMSGVEKILQSEDTSAVLVQGDTNTTLGGALAAAKIGVPLGHIEAGMRSFDRSMPEEINRVAVDHISDMCFTPSVLNMSYLQKEGIPAERIFLTGNTLADALKFNIPIARRRRTAARLGFAAHSYILTTLHRAALVDDRRQITDAIEGLKLVSDTTGLPVVFPCHPRTLESLRRFGLIKKARDAAHLIEPLGYMDFLSLARDSRLIITDSGGIQEEAFYLGIPCVTARDSTEWTETVESGHNILAGTSPQGILGAVKAMLATKFRTPEASHVDSASQKIIHVLEKRLHNRRARRKSQQPHF
jgi:UDP-N-acetylglucosamine 2-epimerase (non-hydrolysing)